MSGVHYVAVSGHRTGTYYLMVHAQNNYEPPGDTTTTAVVEVDGAVSGRIGPHGDKDWYMVSLTEDAEYRITARGRWGPGPWHGTVDYLAIGGVYDGEGSLQSGTQEGLKYLRIL